MVGALTRFGPAVQKTGPEGAVLGATRERQQVALKRPVRGNSVGRELLQYLINPGDPLLKVLRPAIAPYPDVGKAGNLCRLVDRLGGGMAIGERCAAGKSHHQFRRKQG